ncbi:MAG: hypothetical protein JST00_06965 [Deltaproteobacteria bacterium]|nr:hypothetical protein [Deltaproteobacteria bacterium]
MQHRSLSFPALLTLLSTLVAACSSTTTPVGGPSTPQCDPTQCAAKNECIDDGKETKCRLACAKHGDCPFNYQCSVNPANAAKSFCAKSTSEVPQKPTGQWGSPCETKGGEANNPACDGQNGFVCYAPGGPTDATAYCTRFECAADTDCAGGYWCATVNNAPNATKDARSFGPTHTACIKRAYCSPCNADFDCPVIDGKQSRCANDDAGGKYCAQACNDNTNCRLDATCVSGPVEDGAKVCKPRAGVCKGDGSICSPCRSDADCPDGFCLKGPYSPEKFCSVKSKSACTATGQGTIVKGDCPAFTGFAGTKIGCQGSSADDSIPKDQCIGLIEFGETGDIACYTKH